jgi:hypothetical protein
MVCGLWVRALKVRACDLHLDVRLARRPQHPQRRRAHLSVSV